MATPGAGVRVRRLEPSDEAEFLAAARRSVSFHHPWVVTPTTPEAFKDYVKTHDGTTAYAYVLETSGPTVAVPQLVGYINVRQIESTHYKRGVLGFAIFDGFQRQGYMTAGLQQLFDIAFDEGGLDEGGLHRLEAEVQPHNKPSLRLMEKVRFRWEGYARRLIEIDGDWKDHERWAIDPDELQRSHGTLTRWFGRLGRWLGRLGSLAREVGAVAP